MHSQVTPEPLIKAWQGRSVFITEHVSQKTGIAEGWNNLCWGLGMNWSAGVRWGRGDKSGLGLGGGIQSSLSLTECSSVSSFNGLK